MMVEAKTLKVMEKAMKLASKTSPRLVQFNGEISGQETNFSRSDQEQNNRNGIPFEQITRICQLSFTQLRILQHYIQSEHESMLIPRVLHKFEGDSAWFAVADDQVFWCPV
jgi:hypothetical protein